MLKNLLAFWNDSLVIHYIVYEIVNDSYKQFLIFRGKQK
jgi:hypothetical protein